MKENNLSGITSALLITALVFLGVFGSVFPLCGSIFGKLTEECSQHFSSVDIVVCCDDDCCAHECKCYYRIPKTESVPVIITEKFTPSFSLTISPLSELDIAPKSSLIVIDETKLKDQLDFNSCLKNRAPPV